MINSCLLLLLTDNAQTSWADSSSAGMPDRISLPTAPKSAQQVEIDKDKLPPNPPYTIYLGNLPFDCETDDIEKFLIAATCNVSVIYQNIIFFFKLKHNPTLVIS